MLISLRVDLNENTQTYTALMCVVAHYLKAKVWLFAMINTSKSNVNKYK